MILLIQRVTEAAVSIHHDVRGKIGQGLLVLLGIESADDQEDVDWLVRKLVNLRIFNDDQGVMNRSLADIDGQVLLVSQFTLHASTKKGNRPSYIKAARPEVAIPLYQSFIHTLENELGRAIATGEFGADMQVSLVNDGPVTIHIDSKNKQ